jgi:hypothetical protein
LLGSDRRLIDLRRHETRLHLALVI